MDSIGTLQMPHDEALNVEKQITLAPDKIQGMINGTFSNNGFLLKTEAELNDRFNFKSSDISSTYASQRPKLVIQYTLSNETPTPSLTPTPTFTQTPPPTPTGPTSTPTNTSTPTVTLTPSNTPSPTITNTPTTTQTPTITLTPAFTPTPSVPIFSNATFIYDGDGKRVKSVLITNVGSTTTYFVGNYYELTGSEVTKYYYAGSQRIAMRKNGDLFFITGDHLGSTSLVTDSNGVVINETKYKAWGEVRYASGTTPTNYTYTGQYSYVSDFGLMFYNARFYDPSLGRFISADTIIPQTQGVQGYDRYAYVNNNPLRYTDPTGHIGCDEDANGKCLSYPYKDKGPLPKPPKRPAIVTRDQWGAKTPGSGPNANASENEGLYSQNNQKGYKDYLQTGSGNLSSTLDTIVLHHEGDIATMSVTKVQENEMNDGYYDIAYHYIIGPDGTIYEGRPISVRGSHVDGQNTGKIGILWLGDFQPGDTDPNFSDGLDNLDGPTNLQIESTIQLVKWLDYMYGIEAVLPHSALDSTDCPGSAAITAVQNVQSSFNSP